jgi:hypothetical protein
VTDKEAIKTLSGKITNIEDYSKAVAIAGNRLIDCQWHEYHEGDHNIVFGGYYILDLYFDDESHGSFIGTCEYDADKDIFVLEPCHKSPNIKSTIRYWMKVPTRRNNI